MKHTDEFQRKLVRCLWAVKELYDGKKVLTRELAYKFQINQRTAQRDMQALNQAGFALFNKPLGLRGLWYWKKL